MTGVQTCALPISKRRKRKGYDEQKDTEGFRPKSNAGVGNRFGRG